MRSLVAATTSSRFTVANFWADPSNGVSYNLQVQIPEERTQSIEDLGNVAHNADSASVAGGDGAALDVDGFVTEAEARRFQSDFATRPSM